MNSLQELNGFGSISLDVVDERPSGVIFDREAPLLPIDQILNINSTTPTVNAGINIIEVINYSVANVRYRIKITTGGSPLLTGSSISWPSIPAGLSLNISGSTYTLSGINSPAIWNQIKSFTWNLPANYATRPLWFLEISIIYYSSQLGRDVSIDYLAFDQRFFYVSQLTSSFTSNIIGQDCRLFSANLVATINTIFEPKLLEGIIDTLNCNFVINCNARLKPKDDLQSSFNLQCSIDRIFNFNILLNANCNVNCNLTALLTNFIDRNYFTNQENLIFAINTPQIESLDENANYAFSLDVTAGLGGFSSSPTVLPNANFFFRGSKSQINNILSQIRYYPAVGQTGNVSVLFHLTLDNVSQIYKTFNLNYNVGSYTTKLVYITSSSSNYRFNNEDLFYSNNCDLLLVGGGGAGRQLQSPSQPGGGGEVLEFFNVGNLDFITYNVTIGQGGIWGIDQGTGRGNGTSTTFLNRTATFGYGGEGWTIVNGNELQATGNFGKSGSGFMASNQRVDRNSSLQSQASGGGGGANGTGQHPSLTVYNATTSYATPGNGGAGKLSSITGQTYGGGGGGASFQFTGGALAGIIPQSISIAGGGRGAKRYFNFNSSGQFVPFYIAATDGQPNTGGGGGAGSPNDDWNVRAPLSLGGPGNGGSGLVVVRFKP